MVQVPASVVHGTQVHETAEAVDEAPVQVIDEHGVTTEEVEQSAEPEKEEMLHIPLFRGNNADINATLALAIISVFMIQVYGIQFLGLKTYISKFLNFKDPIYFVLGILEIISEVSKVVSFAFRLFGNIFAGEVLLTIVAFLVPVLASFPFVILEVFVGLVQALVFSMLTSVFLSLAVSHH
jgi:F-type H+-transporting ATPase subunit a